MAHAVKTAVVLCGGEGTRLRPFTLKTAKALYPIQGKPLTEHIIGILKKHGITHIILAVGYLGEQVKEHFGDGSGFGVRISYTEEKTPLGTAGPLRLAREAGLLPEETIIVLNGDDLLDPDLEGALKLHKKTGALATIILGKVDDVSHYGVARLEGNKILEFVEKPPPENAPSDLVNTGWYLMEPAVAGMVPEGFVMLEKATFPELAKQGKLFGFEHTANRGWWSDTGTPERVARAEKEWSGV